MNDIQHQVLCAMRPGCFYRTTDIAREIGIRTGQARYALVHLSRGGAWLARGARATASGFISPNSSD